VDYENIASLSKLWEEARQLVQRSYLMFNMLVHWCAWRRFAKMNNSPASLLRRDAILRRIIHKETLPHTANISIPLSSSVHLLTRLQHKLPRSIVAESDAFEISLNA
jgi:NurA-like 5'-3' nuclease